VTAGVIVADVNRNVVEITVIAHWPLRDETDTASCCRRMGN